MKKKQIAIVALVFVADSGCGSRRAFLSGERIVWNFIESLTRIPGIGDWTAQYIALRALGEPDAFPAADLGIIKAL